MSARSRPLFLLQVLLAAPQVRQTAIFVSVVALCAAAGFGAAIIVFAPTSGPTGSLLPLEVAVGAAALAAGVLCLLQLRSARRQHRAEFVRLARRLGEEK